MDTESNERPLKETERLYLAWAIRDLAEALMEKTMLSASYKVRNAQVQLSQFHSSTYSTPELTKEEADLSRLLHTWMRKHWNNPLSTILYRLISEDRGLFIWCHFVKLLLKPGYFSGVQKKLSQMEIASTDNVIMAYALQLWSKEDWLAACGFIHECRPGLKLAVFKP